MRFLRLGKGLNPFGGWSVLFWAAVVFVTACAPSAVTQKGGPEPSPETLQALEHFQEAERLAQAGAYGEAQSIYQAYLDQNPRGLLADRALMKTGLVWMAAGQYEQAIQAFQQLLVRHPRSPFAPDARYNIVLAYYTEGDHDAAVRYAEAALKQAEGGTEAFQIYNLLGYVFSARGEFPRAFESYMEAYARAGEEDRAEVLSKVKEVISYLNEKELVLSLDRYRSEVPGDQLRLQLARIYASEDLVEPALAVLNEFVDLFPGHEEMNTALTMLEELQSRVHVDRHTIGCLLPLSGQYETFGNRALAGIELALTVFNARADVEPVRLVIRDTRGEAGAAVSALEDLVLNEGVVGIIGPMITSEPVALRAQALRVPLVTLTQKPNITLTGDYVFRNFLTLSLQVEALVKYAVEDMGLQTFAVFYPQEPYGVSFMNRFWDELLRRGGEVVGIESYLPDQTDFRDAINKLVGLYYPRVEEPDEPLPVDEEAIWEKLLETQEQESDSPGAGGEAQFPEESTGQDETMAQKEDEGPRPILDFQAVFIPESFEKVALITPQLLYYDVADVLLLGTNLWHSERLIDMARNYVQGAIVPEGFFVDSPSYHVREFVRSYEDLFGKPPSYLEAQAYDTAGILFELVNEPEVRSRLTLKKALLGVENFPGVTGLTSFDETGDVEKEVYLLTIEGSRFVQIKP